MLDNKKIRTQKAIKNRDMGNKVHPKIFLEKHTACTQIMPTVPHRLLYRSAFSVISNKHFC